MSNQVKYLLDENDIPKDWYNIMADFKNPPSPPLHPGTLQPCGPDDLAPLFPMELIMQEVSTERYIEIPNALRDVYRQWRPSPLHRARRLEQALDTPARIYYKYEGREPGRQPQAEHRSGPGLLQQEGRRRAADHGNRRRPVGLGPVARRGLFRPRGRGLHGQDQLRAEAYRKAFMESFGAKCYASPSNLTEGGKAILKESPDSTGSLGIAISEAVERAVQRDDTKYALGSVLNHVLMHQTVIGQEAIKQMEMADDYPDIVVGCTGGGSNFAGIAFPFLGEKLRGGRDVEIVAVEPANCPSLTKGQYAYDFGDTVKMTPLIKMHTLGAGFVPPANHAGGLRYHGMSPLVSQMVHEGHVRPTAWHQTECFAAGVAFGKAEGILPAPEANHAVKGAIDEALKCKRDGRSKAILFNLCGHGNFDMAAYQNYASGELTDDDYNDQELAMALAALPKVA